MARAQQTWQWPARRPVPLPGYLHYIFPILCACFAPCHDKCPVRVRFILHNGNVRNCGDFFKPNTDQFSRPIFDQEDRFPRSSIDSTERFTNRSFRDCCLTPRFNFWDPIWSDQDWLCSPILDQHDRLLKADFGSETPRLIFDTVGRLWGARLLMKKIRAEFWDRSIIRTTDFLETDICRPDIVSEDLFANND